MKARKVSAPIFFLLFSSLLFAQSPPFDIQAYRQFLQTHQNLSAGELQALYSAGRFYREAQTTLSGVPYLDSIAYRYNLTAYERRLLERHSFVVTERLQRPSFFHAFDEIYHYDLPVFVSTDAILHAIHMSYDKILMKIERQFLIRNVDSLLALLHAQVPLLASRYAGTPAMLTSLKDVDVYLTVPRKLLGNSLSPYFPENTATVNQLLQFIQSEAGVVQYPLFGTTSRKLDFSQFKLRGHYTNFQYPELGRYFKAMMWLGRMEIYLIAPQNTIPPVPDGDVQRQAIDAVLLSEAAQSVNAYAVLEEIDGIIRFFVGESDNVTLPNIRALVQMTHTDSASQLLNIQRFRAFQDTLRHQSYAFQLIMSQLLKRDPFSPDSIVPASSFLLLGQRFVIDSYVTSNVVYDRVPSPPNPYRGLPSTLDVLFALGNNATAQLLREEIEHYHYARNLAGLRYLIDAYGNDFWDASMYNGWLNSIRKLNPQRMRDSLPAFMQTAAWWQEKLNTQLASWAQLRHDNLLYAKQSYTGIPICSFPESYVEPYPEFFDVLKGFAQRNAARFQSPPFSDQGIAAYFTEMIGTMDTLGSISRKELLNAPLSLAERDFLKRMLRQVTIGCITGNFDGWYPRLYYADQYEMGGFLESDLVVADVHTCPADAGGFIVGWVLHGGTGPINLGVWITNKPGGGPHAYIGPVMSYYEHVSTNFRRLSDEEWRTAYNLPPSFRPSFVNLYLADSTGNSRGDGINLLTDVGGGGGTAANYPSTPMLFQNYPNPFNPSTFIAFTIPPSYANANVELTIYDVQGQRVQTLVKNTMPAGNFVARWDGRNEKGNVVASGVFFYRLKVGGFVKTKKLIVVR